DKLRRVLAGPIDLVGERLLWAAGSHDVPRSPTRFGGGDLGRERTLVLNVLFSCLPGVPVLYQGEELGLVDGRVPEEAVLDPVDNGRDGCRTPMPWAPGSGNGFTSGEAWLRSEQRADNETAHAQVGEPDSWHSRYAGLLAALGTLPDLVYEPLVWTDGGYGPVIAYRRGPVGVAANTASDEHHVEIPAGASVAYATPGVRVDGERRLALAAHNAAIWVDLS
ncbi:MAG: alpha-amylase family glycosyl hydrolase, partial [Acidimicrobiales bacterium]|nr:alpha-amylase family glycosyl hydrolase [Acidimicrobiales bacterium]